MAPLPLPFSGLEEELLDSEFSDFVKAIDRGDKESAEAFARGFRERLDVEGSRKDETLEWLSKKIEGIEDPELFQKVVDFVAEHDLSPGQKV